MTMMSSIRVKAKTPLSLPLSGEELKGIPFCSLLEKWVPDGIQVSFINAVLWGD